MDYDPCQHHRRCTRLPEHDYAGGGAYFVTACVKGTECLFGEIVDGGIVLNDAGRIVATAWRAMWLRFPSVVFDAFQVMPKHVNAIIVIPGPRLEAALAEATCARVTQPIARPFVPPEHAGPGLVPAWPTPGSRLSVGRDPMAGRTLPTQPKCGPHLSGIVGVFKLTSAIEVNRLLSRTGRALWLQNYFEHIVRDVGELERIREYINTIPNQGFSMPTT
jgi:putative transposase